MDYRRNWTLLALFSLSFLSPCLALQAQESEEVQAAKQMEDPREILSQYPEFKSRERIPTLEDNGYYPCSDCHDNEFQISNPEVRVLEELHDDIILVHGNGRYWCLTCHADEDRDSLWSLKKQLISFDEPYLLCGQCHFQRQKDFFNGAHGKRVGNWNEERLIAPCTECHDPHDPTIKAAVPFPPPKARMGLELPESGHHAPLKPWEKAAANRGLETDEDHPDEEHH